MRDRSEVERELDMLEDEVDAELRVEPFVLELLGVPPEEELVGWIA